MRNFNTMTKPECISLIKRMFGFETYQGMFSEKDDIGTLRSLAASQYDKYLVIANRG
ncbi:TPA: hypothetical protein ACQVKY_005273 [Serratia marcescens]|uniref:Uncharacterized protein n=1 Tax=Serratia nevei TaxID=2703794 RepID=A0ABT7G5J0_9GAMM|nr:hypothetical protein [Serratia nevei]MDK5169028.1 hypothetical protein [Serratia nevei]MDK5298522.1 hypothetical protein [Serratia nevei]MEC5887226.1 hypothetical protein [Serratia nevei]